MNMVLRQVPLVLCAAQREYVALWTLLRLSLPKGMVGSLYFWRIHKLFPKNSLSLQIFLTCPPLAGLRLRGMLLHTKAATEAPNAVSFYSMGSSVRLNTRTGVVL